MRVLVLGAAGRLGRCLVGEAVAAGHEVRALSRSAASAMFPEGVVVLRGDVRLADDVRRALDGAEAVLVAANVQRAAEWNLWSRLVTLPDVVSSGIRHVLEATGDAPGFRVVHCSAHGVGDSRARSGVWFRVMIDHTSVGLAYADHAEAERLLAASRAAWTSVRPVILTNGPATDRVRVGTDVVPGSFERVSRADVARFMVHELVARRFVGQAPTITSAR